MGDHTQPESIRVESVGRFTLERCARLSGMRFRPIVTFGIALALFVQILPAGTLGDAAGNQDQTRIQLTLDTSEADAVLAILNRTAANQAVSDADWQHLFSSEPYVRLKQREASMQRAFADEEFKAFVLSAELQQRAGDLRRTLEDWETADLVASARRVLSYLPPQARIRAKVYPVIKPKSNSFVFEPRTDPAIFLYLDPKEPAAKFENTVAHELHHIGFASVSSLSDSKLQDLPPNVKAAAEWMGAFGEGLAMLAAAGSPDVHPHAVSSAEERARWDRDEANFNHDLNSLQQFFLDVIDGKFKSKEEADQAGYSFFGEQGPWYTVGYKMAVVIERRYGRAALIDCMVDPRELLARYNKAAGELSRTATPKLALWSDELLKRMHVAPAAKH